MLRMKIRVLMIMIVIYILIFWLGNVLYGIYEER